ncbi:hypothetical protein C2E23DRAFT_831118 [Lenzites betulinus]|nr:hypothetical protein C2E23DRAFT_831118 [Lenzites betulinus]
MASVGSQVCAIGAASVCAVEVAALSLPEPGALLPQLQWGPSMWPCSAWCRSLAMCCTCDTWLTHTFDGRMRYLSGEHLPAGGAEFRRRQAACSLD